MNQTDTPLTDVLMSTIPGWKNSSDFDKGQKISDFARRLERDLAKANAEKTVLVEALETASLALLRAGSFVPDNIRNCHIQAHDVVYAALKDQP